MDKYGDYEEINVSAIPDSILDEPETEQGKSEQEKLEEVKKKCLDNIQKCLSSYEQLQNDREGILKAYQREKYGNEVKGRSQVVMSDVYDTVESIMPSLMRVFYGGMDVVDVIPVGPEDELKAKLISAKINYDFQRKLNGFQILYDFFKDALMFKSGVVKYYWKDEQEIIKKEYHGLTNTEIQSFGSNQNIAVESIEPSGEFLPEQPAPFPGLPPIPAEPLFNVKIAERVDISGPIIENLAPEEFLTLVSNRNVKDADFICHRKAIKRQEVAKYGLNPDDITGDLASFDDDALFRQRFEDLGGIDFITPNKEADDIWLYECYFNEYDERGNRLPKISTLISDKIVRYEDNPYGRPPFCIASPVRSPHRMIGHSIAELVLDIQRLRTSLMRFVMDNVYFQNNGMTVINPFRIDATQYQTNAVPGGIVHTKGDWEPGGWIYPVPIKPLPPYIMNLMEYIEGPMKENRTGVTKYNQGLDSKSLNRTAAGISQIMNASQQRVELIARIFAEAEDGVKAIFQALVDMNLKFLNRSVSLKMDSSWSKISPADISGKYDILIDIGAGIGTKEVKVQQMMSMLDRYGEIGAALPAVVTPENIHNLIAGIWESMGFKNSSMYVTDPARAMARQAIPGGPPVPGMPPNMPPEAMGMNQNPQGMMPGGQ